MLCCNVTTSSLAFREKYGNGNHGCGVAGRRSFTHYRKISTHLDGGIENYIPISLEDCTIARNSRSIILGHILTI